MLTQEHVDELRGLLKAPYVNAYLTTIGGADRATIHVTVSLDPKEDWNHRILENSCYARFSIIEGSIEVFSGGFSRENKFRKSRYKTITEAAQKIQKNIDINLAP